MNVMLLKTNKISTVFYVQKEEHDVYPKIVFVYQFY
jgi:hypothetical protein